MIQPAGRSIDGYRQSARRVRREVGAFKSRPELTLRSSVLPLCTTTTAVLLQLWLWAGAAPVIASGAGSVRSAHHDHGLTCTNHQHPRKEV